MNAGHNPPLVYRSQCGSIERLMPTGIILGGLEDQKYGSKTVGIGPGDVAVLYTDGVTESINASEEMFGEERLKALISSHAHLSAEELIGRIFDAVTAFAGDQPQFDDITLMVIKGVG